MVVDFLPRKIDTIIFVVKLLQLHLTYFTIFQCLKLAKR